MMQKPLSELKPGDKVTRLIGAEKIPMPLKVGGVDKGVIFCIGPEFLATPIIYSFNQETGGEIDEGCGWDGITSTGSIIVAN